MGTGSSRKTSKIGDCLRSRFDRVAVPDLAPRFACGWCLSPVLRGGIALEQAGAAVDMLGHRLMHVKRVDLK